MTGQLVLFQIMGRGRGVFREGFCGSKPLPPFLGNFFQFKKKIPKSPLKFPVHTKKIPNLSLEKFLDTPLGRGVTKGHCNPGKMCPLSIFVVRI